LVAATHADDIKEFLTKLKAEFKITEKPASFFLGIQLDKQEDGSIKISQQAYAKKILERFGMGDCNPVKTPIVKPGGEAEEDGEESHNFPYREAVGALMYLMTGTRPDIAYAVGVVSRTLENPTYSDWLKVKRIFRYLKGTCEYGIVYRPDYKPRVLECYSDADHGGDSTTGRSTSGVVCIYAGGAISWLSQRQQSVAISTTEAEVMAASEATREAVWLKRLLGEIVALHGVPILQVDNEAEVRLAQNPENHRRTKHIAIRHFFIREKVMEGEINVQRVSTEEQLADIFTKPLHKPRLLSMCVGLGLTV